MRYKTVHLAITPTTEDNPVRRQILTELFQLVSAKYDPIDFNDFISFQRGIMPDPTTAKQRTRARPNWQDPATLDERYRYSYFKQLNIFIQCRYYLTYACVKLALCEYSDDRRYNPGLLRGQLVILPHDIHLTDECPSQVSTPELLDQLEEYMLGYTRRLPVDPKYRVVVSMAKRQHY